MINVTLDRAKCHGGYHYELINHPPKDVSYHLIEVDKVIPMDAVFDEPNNWKKYIQFKRYYYRGYDYTPYFSNSPQLVHAHLHPVVNRVPYVIDIDMLFYPFLIDDNEFNRIKALTTTWPLSNKLPPQYRKRLEMAKIYLSSSLCKRILPWSQWCKNYIEDLISDPKILKKIEVLYPAVHNINCQREQHKTITLLYSGNIFIKKGGMDVLKAFEILRRDYNNLVLIFIGEVPLDIFKKYKKYKNIKFYGFLEKKNVLQLYREADIFVLATRNDTFGISLLEAMNFELPIVTTKGESVPVSREIVDDGISGFLIELKNSKSSNYFTGKIVFSDFIAKLRLLIENRNLRTKMGKAGKQKIVDGKFSLKKRNERLRKIYEEALR